jgi:hypothetical protein
MDSTRFDRLSRTIGKQTDRRGMFKVTAAAALGLVTAGAARHASAANRGPGSGCDTSDDCGAGLECVPGGGFLASILQSGPYGPPGAIGILGLSTGRCEFRNNCSHVDQYCDNDGDCCNGSNLFCDRSRNQCRRNN